jgi:hypothetical protein
LLKRVEGEIIRFNGFSMFDLNHDESKREVSALTSSSALPNRELYAGGKCTIAAQEDV